jgi:hypothetical protein
VWQRVNDGQATDPKQRFVKGLAAVSVAVWFVYIGLFLKYAGTRPRCPDPSTGRIYSINNHGAIAYLNLSENLWLYGLSGMAIALFGIAFALDRWKR